MGQLVELSLSLLDRQDSWVGINHLHSVAEAGGNTPNILVTKRRSASLFCPLKLL